ncbi:MAG: shikimate kinase [Syntrophomonadaceae bacterium]|nr:shikimate kinase [Syntrophomonadaceae bacterium]
MNIVLVGMPGAGKSTMGVLLAKALGMDFVDTDILIQQHEGRLLQDIINEDGIEKFLTVEEQAVAQLQLENCVIATGGSIIYSEKAMHNLRQGGKIFYLDVPYAQIEQRLKNIATRGIVMQKGKSLREIYNERVPLYIRYSDEIIACADQRIEDCVREMVRRIMNKVSSSNRW